MQHPLLADDTVDLQLPQSQIKETPTPKFLNLLWRYWLPVLSSWTPPVATKMAHPLQIPPISRGDVPKPCFDETLSVHDPRSCAGCNQRNAKWILFVHGQWKKGSLKDGIRKNSNWCKSPRQPHQWPKTKFQTTPPHPKAPLTILQRTLGPTTSTVWPDAHHEAYSTLANHCFRLAYRMWFSIFQ